MATNAYYLNQFISTTLSTAGGIDDSQTTGIKIASTSGVTTDKPGILCLSYSDPIDITKAEWISYTSIDVFNELQGVTRGEEGFSAKAHSNGVTVAFPISRSHINNLNDALIIDDTETNLLEGILDEDDMASNSATKGVTQQSTKAYVDNGTWLKDSIFRQAIINASCQINQIVTPVNLTTGKLYGTDTFYAKGAGTAVSAGTIGNTASPALTTAFADKLAGVTLTGTGIIYGYRNIDSANAIHYKNKTASFSILVRHDVGSAINYTIKINKANSANVFSAVTQIAASSAISVPSGADTLIKLEGVSMGDCSNGIEIEIIAECGAITTKNFEFSQWQFNEGSVVLPYMAKRYEDELKSCQRLYVVYGGESGYRKAGVGTVSNATSAYISISLPEVMRTAPSNGISVSNVAHWTVANYATQQCTNIAYDDYSNGLLTLRADVASGLTANDSCRLQANNTNDARIYINVRPAIA